MYEFDEETLNKLYAISFMILLSTCSQIRYFIFLIEIISLNRGKYSSIPQIRISPNGSLWGVGFLLHKVLKSKEKGITW